MKMMKLPYKRADGTIVLWPKYLEVVQQLARHPGGLTSRELTDMLGHRPAQIYGRLRMLRELGVVEPALDVVGDEIVDQPNRWALTDAGRATAASHR